MIEIYIGIIAILYWIEPILWWYFIKSSHLVHIKKCNIFLLLFGYYVLTIVKQYIAYNSHTRYISLLTTIILLIYIITATYWIVRDSLKESSILLGVFMICDLCSEIIFVMLYILVTNLNFSEVSQFGFHNVMCTLGARVLLFVLYRLLFHKRNDQWFKEIYDNSKSLPLLLSVVLFEIPFSMVYCYSDKVLENTFVVYFFLMVQLYLVGVVIHMIHILYSYQRDFDELTYELQRSRSVNELGTQLSQLRHDMAFYVSMIEHFVYKGQYEELHDYVCGIADELRQVQDIFILSDQIVANTLNIMAGKAREKNIVFEHIIIGSEFNITSKELSKVLFNILENAIEAVELLEKEQRMISLEMSCRNGGYRIRCINNFCKESLSVRELFSTSKSNVNLHGKGLSIIKRVVERNNGVMKIQLHNTLFEVDCFIPDKREGYS